MVFLNVQNAFNYVFTPTNELKNELEEAVSSGDWNTGPIIVKKKHDDFTIIINDELSAEMLIQLYEAQVPTEWKSILRYLYVMV